MGNEKELLNVSKATIGRLPAYHRYLQEKLAAGEKTVSSTAIAEDLHLNAVQVRKDLSAIAREAGKPKLGFAVDERDYGVGAQILRHIGITKMRLMTNNPVKRVGLEAYGLSVVENVPIEITPNPYNEFYLHTKKERMGHTLHNVK